AAAVPPVSEVDHGYARQHARLERLADALFDRRNVFPRDRAADDLVLELEPLARLVRLDLEVDVAVLAAAARLPHVTALGLGFPAVRLAVGDLRLSNLSLRPDLPSVRT